jgi:glutathione S-transferase
MILIGQFDSPFVRRVGITLRHYGVAFEHRPWAVFRDAEKIGALNPVRRVPTLVLGDGTVLTETFVCLEVLDDIQASVDASRLLLPRTGAARRAGLRTVGFATGLADKTVSLIYERVIREQRSVVWSERCTKQVLGTLQLLESEFVALQRPFFLGDQLSHADIAVSCALTLLRDGLPGWLDPTPFPRLHDLQSRCEALPIFQQTFQMFDAPLA